MSTYYKGRIVFEYISADSLKADDLDAILNECDSGGAVGKVIELTETPVTNLKEANRLAASYGSDEFFFEEDEA